MFYFLLLLIIVSYSIPITRIYKPPITSYTITDNDWFYDLVINTNKIIYVYRPVPPNNTGCYINNFVYFD